MNKKNKSILILLMCSLLFFMTISSISAASYYVTSGTSQSEIQGWIDNAKKGDNLVFTTSSYELKNTIKVTKPITIKSNVKTNINFKVDKNMFNITTTDKVTFDGLRLNHDFTNKIDYNSTEYDGTPSYYNLLVSTLYSSKGFKKINIQNTDINVNGKYGGVINLKYNYGNIKNCNIKVNHEYKKGYGLYAFSSNNWIGNITNSVFSMKNVDDVPLFHSENLSGNIINTKISYYGNSDTSSVVSINNWKGKLHNTTIHKNSKNIPKINDYGVCFYVSRQHKGYISNCTMISNSGPTVKIPVTVKISNCTLKSKKSAPKIIVLKADLSIGKIKKIGRNYYIQMVCKMTYEDFADIGPVYMGIKVGKHVKKIKASYALVQPSEIVKIKIPAKYANKKYTKIFKVDYYNQVIETNEKNNIKKIKY